MEPTEFRASQGRMACQGFRAFQASKERLASLDCRDHQDWMVYQDGQDLWDRLGRKVISVPQGFLEFRARKARKATMEYPESRVCPESPGPWDQEGHRDHLVARLWWKGLWDAQEIRDRQDQWANKDFKACPDLWDPQEARESQVNEETQEKPDPVVSRENREPKEHQGAKVFGACRAHPDVMVSQAPQQGVHPRRAHPDPRAFLATLGLKDHRVKRAVVVSSAHKELKVKRETGATAAYLVYLERQAQRETGAKEAIKVTKVPRVTTGRLELTEKEGNRGL